MSYKYTKRSSISLIGSCEPDLGKEMSIMKFVFIIKSYIKEKENIILKIFYAFQKFIQCRKVLNYISEINKNKTKTKI